MVGNYSHARADISGGSVDSLAMVLSPRLPHLYAYADAILLHPDWRSRRAPVSRYSRPSVRGVCGPAPQTNRTPAHCDRDRQLVLAFHGDPLDLRLRVDRIRDVGVISANRLYVTN